MTPTETRLREAVKLLRIVCIAAKNHIAELEEAWRTGALSERDGKGGTRSNRNLDTRCNLEVALAATADLDQEPTP